MDKRIIVQLRILIMLISCIVLSGIHLFRARLLHSTQLAPESNMFLVAGPGSTCAPRKRHTEFKPPYIFVHTHLPNHIVVMRYNFLIFMDFDYLCRRFSILLDCVREHIHGKIPMVNMSELREGSTHTLSLSLYLSYKYICRSPCDQHQNTSVVLFYCWYL